MRTAVAFFIVFTVVILFSACRNKTVMLLSKKWDCVAVENMVPAGSKGLSAKDSANAEQVKTLLLTLNWTFKDRMKYECALNDRVAVEGKYELLENDKIMICTPESKNGSNRYIIRSLTENELVLAGNAENTNLILHFKPH